MTTISPTLCRACAHADRPAGATATWAPTRCSAYPDYIPDEIALLAGDHRRPRGDETDGLVFEQDATDGAAEAFDEWQRFAGVDAG